MSKQKKYRLAGKDIKRLVNHNGGCIATDRITVDGLSVGYMYREPPDNDADTGWRFMAGDESQDYMDDADNHGVYAVNTIANYDREILPFIDAPIGAAFARNSETGRFELVASPVDPDDCLHPDYPVVSGDYQLTETWSVSLPLKFNRRIEDGSLILWRPGLTIYFTAWNNDHQESADDGSRNDEFRDSLRIPAKQLRSDHRSRNAHCDHAKDQYQQADRRQVVAGCDLVPVRLALAGDIEQAFSRCLM